MTGRGPGVVGVVLVAMLFGCLETEEQITVREDGSARVQLRVAGDIDDLASGWSVPVAGPWTPVGRTSVTWWERGASLEPEKLQALAKDLVDDSGRRVSEAGDRLELSVLAEFDRLEEIPETNLPAGAAHPEAHLRRLSHLEITRRGRQRFYRFERVYKTGSRAAWTVWRLADDAFPEELRKRITSDEPVSSEDWDRVARIVSRALVDQAVRAVRESLAAAVAEGEESWSTSLIRRLIARSRDVSSGVATERRILAIAAAEEARRERRRWEKHEPAEPSDRFDELEHDLRAALREAVGELLQGEVASETRALFLDRLDRSFVAFDAVRDLGDETFRIHVQMPGMVISGNYDRLEGSQASWTIKGKTLQEHDVRLEVVSLLE